MNKPFISQWPAASYLLTSSYPLFRTSSSSSYCVQLHLYLHDRRQAVMRSFFDFKLEEEEMRRKMQDVSEADGSFVFFVLLRFTTRSFTSK